MPSVVSLSRVVFVAAALVAGASAPRAEATTGLVAEYSGYVSTYCDPAKNEFFAVQCAQLVQAMPFGVFGAGVDCALPLAYGGLEAQKQVLLNGNPGGAVGPAAGGAVGAASCVAATP